MLGSSDAMTGYRCLRISTAVLPRHAATTLLFFMTTTSMIRFVEKHVEALQRYPTAAFAGGNRDIIDSTGRRIRRPTSVRRTELWSGRRFIEDIARRGRGRISTRGMLFRTATLRQIGFDENLSMHWGDYITQMRLAEESDVAMLADRMLRVRIHGSNASNIPLSQSFQLRAAIMTEYCRELTSRHPQEAAFAVRLQRLIDATYRNHLALAWLTASNEPEAEACLGQLKKSHTFPGACPGAALRCDHAPAASTTCWTYTTVALARSRRRRGRIAER